MKKFLHFKHRLLLALLTAFLAVPQAWAQDETYVAEVSGNKYGSLQEAINNSGTGGTITLLKDLEVNQMLTVYHPLTIDLAGHNITGTGGVINSSNQGTYVLFLLSFTSKTYSDAGVADAVTIKDSKGTGAINVSASAATALYGFYVSGCKFNFDSGTINVNNENDNASAIGVYGTTDATLTINGATITASSNTNAIGVYLAATSATGTITGGKVKATNYPIAAVDGANLSVSAGYFSGKVWQFIAKGSTEFELDSTKEAEAQLISSGYNYQVATIVAQIVGDYYRTLQEAINAATDGQTVTLQADVNTLANINGKNIVLDLNNHKIDRTGTSGNTGLYVLGGSTVTVKNGTITTEEGAWSYGVYITGASDVTVENVTVNASVFPSYCFNVGGNNNKLTINSGTFTSGYWDLAYIGANNTIDINGGTFNGCVGVSGNGNSGNSGNVVTVDNATFNPSYNTYNGTGYAAQGFYLPNNDIVSIDNTTITVNGDGQGVVARAGTVTLGSGVKITTNGTGTTAAGDKETALPSAVVVFDATTPDYPGLKETNGVATVKITGGTYTSAVEPVVTIVRDSDATNTGKYIEVSGGTFSSAVDEDYCVADFVPQKNSDGTYGVTAANENNAVSYTTTDDWLTENNESRTYITGSKIELTDTDVLASGKYWSFKVPVQKTGQTITYTRTFNNSNDQCWFVPFSVNVKDYVDKVRFYAISVTTAGAITFSTVEDGDTLMPNHPYVVRCLESTPITVTFISSNDTLYKTDETNTITLAAYDNKGNQSEFTISGNYSAKPVTDSDKGWYALSSKGNLSLRNGDVTTNAKLTLKPFRWFLKNTNSTSASKSAISIIHTDDDVTGINSINASASNKANVIYDLQGNRVNNPEKGIYIINGKKVLIK